MSSGAKRWGKADPLAVRLPPRSLLALLATLEPIAEDFPVGEANVCTSVIVATERRHGAAKKASERLSTQLELMLAAFEVLPFETPADAVYGDIRAQLERTGTVIGGNDLLIAAQALAGGHTVVTDNVREFDRVNGSAVTNWLRARRHHPPGDGRRQAT